MGAATGAREAARAWVDSPRAFPTVKWWVAGDRGKREYSAGGPPVHHTGEGLRVVNLQLRPSLPPAPHFDCFDLLAVMMSA